MVLRAASFVMGRPSLGEHASSAYFQVVESRPEPYPSRSEFVVFSGVTIPDDVVSIRRTSVLMKLAPMK